MNILCSACYQWLPQHCANNDLSSPEASAKTSSEEDDKSLEPKKKTEIKFVVYILHGYRDTSRHFYDLIKMFTSLGGAVYSHEFYGHGNSGDG